MKYKKELFLLGMIVVGLLYRYLFHGDLLSSVVAMFIPLIFVRAVYYWQRIFDIPSELVDWYRARPGDCFFYPVIVIIVFRQLTSSLLGSIMALAVCGIFILLELVIYAKEKRA